MAKRGKYWLLKSEPDVFSIDDLESAKDQTTYWDGVRNYQARNMMRDDMQVGDQVLYYHSGADPSGVAGVAEIVKAGYPDFASWDESDLHYDPKSTAENPRWFMVDVKFVEKFAQVLPLSDLKADPKLEGMELLRKGSRLSVQPVSAAHFKHVLKLGRKLG